MIQTERLSLWTKQESVYSGHILPEPPPGGY